MQNEKKKAQIKESKCINLKPCNLRNQTNQLTRQQKQKKN